MGNWEAWAQLNKLELVPRDFGALIWTCDVRGDTMAPRLRF